MITVATLAGIVLGVLLFTFLTIALDIEELNTLRESLQYERTSVLSTDPNYLAAIDKLDNRLSMAINRCVKNRGGSPAPHWSEGKELGDA